MKRNLVFIRHGKVDLPYATHGDMPFSVLNELATQRLDPSSDKSFFKLHSKYFEDLFTQFTFTSLFRSSSKRCATLETYTQSLIPGYSLTSHGISELSEITFDLDILFKGNQQVNVADINDTFFDALFSHQPGIEVLEDVVERIKVGLDKLPSSGNTLILTHGYLMEMIAAYITTLRSGEPLTKELVKTVPAFGYFDGFVVNEENVVTYISTKTKGI